MPARRIQILQNDPLAATTSRERQRTPHPDRPTGRAGFEHKTSVDVGIYAVNTPEFLYWQCREAAHVAIAAWEVIDGPLTRWAREREKLTVYPNRGTGLNAYYDRASLSFLSQKTAAKTTFAGASLDIVAHEVGHAILDSLRPDLWNSNHFEVTAFHEAFGDCHALVTALHDRRTREEVASDLGRRNFVECFGEDLADGVRRVLPLLPAASREKLENASRPRRLLNRHRWRLPTTLPHFAPAGGLSHEAHSFGQVFAGCFYDIIRNIFAASPSQTPQELWKATAVAAKLLAAAARAAPHEARFFQAVGRAMILADEQEHGGRNHVAIRDAFRAHDIALGSSAMLAPTVDLGGTAPNLSAIAEGAILSRSTQRSLRARIRAGARARIRTSIRKIGGELIAEARHTREVALGSLDKRLRGVVADGIETVLVGVAGDKAAALGALPNPDTTADEVLHYVKSLVRGGCIDFAKKTRLADELSLVVLPTHRIRTLRGRRTLQRVRFTCGATSW